jgi:hypothetical protein
LAVNKSSIWLLALILLSQRSAVGQGKPGDCTAEAFPPRWSADATYLCSWATKGRFARDIRVFSPDHKKAVHVIDEHWLVEIGGKKLSLAATKSYVSDYPAELAWSPDSRAFYITQSDGTSELQGFHTEAYLVDEQGVRPLPHIDRIVHRRFDRRHKCLLYFAGESGRPGDRFEDDYANVAGFKWVDGSSRLILVAEIPPDQACGEHRGYFGSYLLSTSDLRIIRQYSPEELVQEWGASIGFRLKANYDDLTLVERKARP